MNIEELKKFISEELADLLQEKIVNKYGLSDYNGFDHDWDNYVREALKEISDEL
jgi:hypothetical protein